MIEINTFELKRQFEEIGGDERSVKVFSSGLGKEAVDNNSFLNLLCQEVNTTFNGVKFIDMKNERFVRRGQKPKIEGDIGLLTFEEYWPLH